MKRKKMRKIRTTDRLRSKLAAKDFEIRALLAGRDMRDREIAELCGMANNAVRILIKLLEDVGGEARFSTKELSDVNPKDARVYPEEGGEVLRVKIVREKSMKE